jgi:hypothetical protein
MKRIAVFILAAALGGFAVLGGAAPAGAASATGCKGSATSFTDAKAQLDKGAAPGAGGTADHPFEIQYDGTVQYDATTNDALQGGSWTVESSVFSFSGDIGGTNTTQSGTEKVSDHIPFVVPGLYKVKITADAPGKTSCTVEGWIRIIDSPVGSPLWFGALGLIVVGIPLLFFGMPTERRS